MNFHKCKKCCDWPLQTCYETEILKINVRNIVTAQFSLTHVILGELCARVTLQKINCLALKLHRRLQGRHDLSAWPHIHQEPLHILIVHKLIKGQSVVGREKVSCRPIYQWRRVNSLGISVLGCIKVKRGGGGGERRDTS